MGPKFVHLAKTSFLGFFQDQMYYYSFIQNLYILVKLFGKNFMYKFFGFSGPNVHFWVQNYSFYPKFVHFSEIFCKNFILE